ncbi:MAG: hypothetical protein JXA71_00145 [Chitinispirillaceae bacterium]|nr:hypothetical protein [Chitinispirillaceae bacterium]
MSVIAQSVLTVLFITVAWCLAAEKETAAQDEKPAFELGGHVTVDYAKDLAKDTDPSFGIGEADFSANVNVSGEVVASISVRSHHWLDSLRITQAVVAWTPSRLAVEFLFGQQAMNHGLLTTRMISDPLLLDDVELVCPAVIINSPFFDYFRGGFGFTVLSRFDDLTLENIYLHTAVVNIDALLPGESIVRLSSRANPDGIDIDIAGAVNCGNAGMDFEGLYSTASENRLLASGFYAGLQYAFGKRIYCALRADAVSLAAANFENMDMRIGGGVSFRIKDGIFCALELAQRRPFEGETANEIALEVGLEQTIRLPGFQRKTLTRNQWSAP